MKIVASLFAVLAVPAQVLACSMCLSENEESRIAFIGTTIVMTLLPLAVFGGTIRWIVKRSEALRIEDEAQGSAGLRPSKSSSFRH